MEGADADAETAGEGSADGVGPQENVSQWRLLVISLFWFAHMAQWSSIFFILLPANLVIILGADNKATYLSLVVMGAGVVSLVAAPLFGALSDRTMTTRGRRLPFVIGGSFGVICMLLGMALSGRRALAGLWISLFMFHQLFSSIASTPYTAIYPDLVPRHQLGVASAYLTVMTLLGILGGIILSSLVSVWQPLLLWPPFVLNIGFSILGSVIVFLTLRELPRRNPLPPFSCMNYIAETMKPFRDPSFSAVFWSRLFMLTAQYLLLQFFQYFLRDVVSPYQLFSLSLGQSEGAYAFFVFVSLIGSVMAGLLTGLVADRIRRKIIMVAGGVICLAPVIALTVVRDYTAIVFLGFVLGVGVGLYVTAGWALAIDVLPSQDHARDLGIWGATSVVPQCIGAPVAGLMLDGFQALGPRSGVENLGYIVVFIVAAVLIVGGTLPILRTRERTRYPGLNIVAALRQSFTQRTRTQPSDAVTLRPTLERDATAAAVDRLHRTLRTPPAALPAVSRDGAAVGAPLNDSATGSRASGPRLTGSVSVPDLRTVVVDGTAGDGVAGVGGSSGGLLGPAAPPLPAAPSAAVPGDAAAADASSAAATEPSARGGTSAGAGRAAPKRVVIRTGTTARRPTLSVRDVEVLMSNDETAVRSAVDL